MSHETEPIVEQEQKEQEQEQEQEQAKEELVEVDLSGVHHHVVDLESCGPVDVFVQGDLESGKNGDTVFLTVHGIGNSFKTWVNFMNHEDMVETRDRSLVLHICLPGQQDGAEDLTTVFPDMTSLGMDLVTVLDQLRVHRVVVMGEGAGANIAARFAMFHPTRVQGVLLVNCKHAEASFPRKFKVMRNTNFECDKKLNKKNVAKYEQAYKERDEILTHMGSKISVDTLVICGNDHDQLVKSAEEIHANIPIGLCDIIKVDDVRNVMSEAPEKLADSFILFCQGLGLVPSVQRKISRSFSMNGDTIPGSNDDTDSNVKPRKISMEMFDIPNIRRLSLSTHDI